MVPLLLMVVFPARAGMSLKTVMRPIRRSCVPRVSGDEPGGPFTGNVTIRCSPRERG